MTDAPLPPLTDADLAQLRSSAISDAVIAASDIRAIAPGTVQAVLLIVGVELLWQRIEKTERRRIAGLVGARLLVSSAPAA